MHTDFDTSQLLGKEHALLICNHGSDIDWLIGWVLAQHAGCLGSALAIMKKEGFRQLEDFPMPFWLALFVEGTCFTQQKLALAQEFAASRGWPAPRNVLIPRTKLQKCTCFQLKYLQKKSPFLVFKCAWLWGFVAAVSHMHSFVPAIYNCTISIPKDQPPPTMLRLFRGQTSVIRRHLMSELPETDDDASQWCKDVFVTKVVIFWFCLIVLGIVEFVGWSTLLSTWEGIAIAFSYSVLVTIIMQILIHSSESERSTPAKLSSEDPIKQSLIQKHAENNTTLAI